MSESEFLELYNQTAAALRRYAARTLGSAAMADDIVQETYARALSSDALPAGAAQARAYLFRIASNLMVDHWRRRKRERDTVDTADNVTQNTQADLHLDLTNMLARLRLSERQLLWLAHVEGADHATIAAMLGLSEGSVRVLLHRAKRKLAEMLKGAGYG